MSVSNMTHKIGVVTVLFNSSSVLPGLFASLTSQEHSHFHVWAIDNASTDASVKQCLDHGSNVTVIANQTNIGVAAANNQGIHAAMNAGCDSVLLLNNDVEFGPDLFAKLVAGLDDNQADMTAPIMYYFDRPNTIWSAGGKFQPLFGYRCYHLEDGTLDVGQFTRPVQVQHAPTCCVLFKRSVFEQVGFMDERYFVYHDDTDFMLRCSKAHLRLFILPHAGLLHKVSTLTGGGESEFSIRMGTRNRIYMLSKFLGKFLAAPYVAILSLSYLASRVIGRFDNAKYTLKQRSLREGYRMAENWFPYRGI